jgi:hypothetical protein
MEIHKTVGENLGLSKSNRYRIQELESSKVSWKALTTIGSFAIAILIGVGKFLFDRGATP